MSTHSRAHIDEDALLELNPGDFAAEAEAALLGDLPLENLLVQGETFEKADFSRLHFSRVLFVNCRFLACRFRRASLADVVFRSCDVSASDFCDSRLVRCEFKNSKAMGTLFCAGYMQDLWLEDCKAGYLNLSESRMFFARFSGSELAKADFSRCELKSAGFDNCDLSGANFMRTPLKGIDLRGCAITGLGVQLESPELKGAVMDFTQLADLADMLGITLR